MEWLVLDRNTWNYLTVYKQMSSKTSIKNKVTYQFYPYK